MKNRSSALLLALAAPANLLQAAGALYMNAPPYQATPGGAYAPAPPLQPTPGGAYAPAPAPQPTPGSPDSAAPGALAGSGNGAAPLQAAPADAGARAVPQSQVVQVGPSAASRQAPSAAQAPADAPASSGAGPVNAQAAPAQATATATGPPVAAAGFPDQATQVPLISDPWRRSQQVLNEIAARQRDGSLAAEKAMELRAELTGLRVGIGLRRPSDGRHLSRAERRSLMRQLAAEDAEVRRDAGQAQP